MTIIIINTINSISNSGNSGGSLPSSQEDNTALMQINDLALYGDLSYVASDHEIMDQLFFNKNAVNHRIIDQDIFDAGISRSLHLGNMLSLVRNADTNIDWSSIATLEELYSNEAAITAVLNNIEQEKFLYRTYADIALASNIQYADLDTQITLNKQLDDYSSRVLSDSKWQELIQTVPKSLASFFMQTITHDWLNSTEGLANRQIIWDNLTNSSILAKTLANVLSLNDSNYDSLATLFGDAQVPALVEGSALAKEMISYNTTVIDILKLESYSSEDVIKAYCNSPTMMAYVATDLDAMGAIITFDSSVAETMVASEGIPAVMWGNNNSIDTLATAPAFVEKFVNDDTSMEIISKSPRSLNRLAKNSDCRTHLMNSNVMNNYYSNIASSVKNTTYFTATVAAGTSKTSTSSYAYYYMSGTSATGSATLPTTNTTISVVSAIGYSTSYYTDLWSLQTGKELIDGVKASYQACAQIVFGGLYSTGRSTDSTYRFGLKLGIYTPK